MRPNVPPPKAVLTELQLVWFKVVELGAERQPRELAYRELLADSRVPNDEPRAANHADAAVTELARRGRSERGYVKPVFLGSRAVRWSTRSVRPRRQARAGNRQARRDCESTLHAEESAELPIAQDLAQNVPESRQRVDVIHAEHGCTIEVYPPAVSAPIQNVLRCGISRRLGFADCLAERVSSLQRQIIGEAPLKTWSAMNDRSNSRRN